ncbi:Hypothetical predicted protein [Paramuricea clavata]|uniref:Uncharacterized protein n=1 Tax=Paramuricea clavata TaxID=317549 RepID=A0A6S7J187_PARCT|nr:Hypothetical predicted protein [Paramuricea clavata]
MRVGEEGIEVIGGGATPALHKTITYTKTGESDEGTAEKFSLGISQPDFDKQLDVSREIVAYLFKSVLDQPIKFTETLVLKMVRGLVSEGRAVDLPMTSEAITVMSVNEVEDAVRLSAERIVGKIESYQERGSNWRVIMVEGHELDVVHFNPLEGISFIELPAPLRSDKNGLINIENRDDNECFRWCQKIRRRIRLPDLIENLLRHLIIKERLDEHSGTCREVNGTQKTMMPKIGSKVVFKDQRRPLPAQFVIYADFESLLIPVDEKKGCLRKIQSHETCGYGFKRVCYYDSKYDGEYKGYSGVGAVRKFLADLLAEVEKCNQIIKDDFNKKVDMTIIRSNLERLVGNLNKGRFLRMQGGWQGEELEMLLKKGVYPYEYMDSWERFDEKRLPGRSASYSSLYEEGVNEQNYLRAKRVYRRFNSDVFEDFRRVCLENYKLDPAHYISAPGLSLDAMLKRTGVKLDLLSNVNMYQFIEKGMRGGTSYIGHRYARANNKYMSDHDSGKPSSYIMYYDANNLYGCAMSEELPYGKFKWVSVGKLNLDKYGKDKEKGLILEVDLKYPSELDKGHSDYHLAPEKMEITEDMLSGYARGIRKARGSKSAGVKKLVTTLNRKKSYVCHVDNLKLYMKLGMKLVKISRALEFSHSKWLKEYIQFNTDMRTVAKNDFEKNFLKLMNNSVFRKTMENLRKRVDVKLMVDIDGDKLKKMLHHQVSLGLKY